MNDRNLKAIHVLCKYGAIDRTFVGDDKIYKVKDYLTQKKSPFHLHGIKITNLEHKILKVLWEDNNIPNIPKTREIITQELSSRMGETSMYAVPILFTALAMRGINIEPKNYLPGLDKIIISVPEDVYDNIDIREFTDGVRFKQFGGIYATPDIQPEKLDYIKGYSVQSKEEAITHIMDLYVKHGYSWLYREIEQLTFLSEKY
jgi:hypothetical protein